MGSQNTVSAPSFAIHSSSKEWKIWNRSPPGALRMMDAVSLDQAKEANVIFP